MIRKKTKISVDFLFLLLLALFFSDKAGGGLGLFLAPLCHEAAHLLCLFCMKRRPRRIFVSFLGIGVEGGREGMRPREEALLLLAGPVVNLFLASVFFCALPFSLRTEFALPQFVCGLWNLMPVSVTDGGRLFALLLSRWLSPDKVRLFLFAFSFFFLLGLLFLATLSLFFGEAPVLPLLSIFYLAFSLFGL